MKHVYRIVRNGIYELLLFVLLPTLAVEYKYAVSPEREVKFYCTTQYCIVLSTPYCTVLVLFVPLYFTTYCHNCQGRQRCNTDFLLLSTNK